MTLIRDLGEFALIDRIAARLVERLGGFPNGDLGIGDDAALWRPTPEWASVATTDTMVEGVHFTTTTTPWNDLGWKSLAVNVSDIAAMAATPRLALITLGLTGAEALSDLDALYDGVAALAAGYGMRVVGGDTVRAPQVQVGFTAIGEAPAPSGVVEALYRHAARPGDLLVVTGHTGDAAGGLRLLLRGMSAPDALVQAHRRPRPRVAEARWLYDHGVRCATDSSDGLTREASLLATASGLAVQIDATVLPISAPLREAFAEEAIGLALAGGEDYELVLAMAPERLAVIQDEFASCFATALTAVGTFVGAVPGRPVVQVTGYAGPTVEFHHFPDRPA